MLNLYIEQALEKWFRHVPYSDNSHEIKSIIEQLLNCQSGHVENIYIVGEHEFSIFYYMKLINSTISFNLSLKRNPYIYNEDLYMVTELEIMGE